MSTRNNLWTIFPIVPKRPGLIAFFVCRRDVFVENGALHDKGWTELP